MKTSVQNTIQKTNYDSTQSFSIKAWAEEDQPREKLLLKGRQYLSDTELLAIILGSGSREESAVGLAKRILNNYEDDLHELGKASLDELIKNFKGVGEAKAITIAAALELGRRRQLGSIKEKPQISSSKDAYNLIASKLYDLHIEQFWILLLNRSNKVIGREKISSGGVAGTVVDAKVIFSCALKALASGVILVHNHPSGNRTPSKADIELTRKLKIAGNAIEIDVLDHLIIADASYYSFADEGMM